MKMAQGRVIRIAPEPRNFSYENRLIERGLTSLEPRRLRGEQI